MHLRTPLPLWIRIGNEGRLDAGPSRQGRRGMSAALWWIAGIAAAWVLVMSGVARGGVIYVDSRLGDDRYDGQSQQAISTQSGPVQSLERAVAVARAGDTIALAAGPTPYYCDVTLFGDRHSGLPGSPFQIVGNGAVLSGAKPIAGDEWQLAGNNLWRITPVRKAHYQLVLDDAAVPEMECPRDASALPDIPTGQWCVWRGAVYYRSEAGLHPRLLNLSLADRDVGLTLLDVHDVIISNVVLRHYRLDGLNAHDRCRNVLLENVTCEENGRAGVTVAGTSQVQVVDSRLVSNRRHSLLITERGAADVQTSELDVAPTLEQ